MNISEELTIEIGEWLKKKGLSPDDYIIVVVGKFKMMDTVANPPWKPDLEILKKPIGTLNLPWGVLRQLEFGGISTIEDLYNCRARGILQLRRCGITALRLIREKLRNVGLKLDETWKTGLAADRDWEPDTV